MNTYNNPVLEKLPLHLKQYIVEQQYERYTPVDQAVWRYVMRQNYSYLKDVAYYPYIPGLKKAGLSIEQIPDLQSMNDSLKQIGWGAATVDGFIPPVSFMEFQAHKVLVIAADIRQIEHIKYTPAPDIIHESSGHAPIIAEPEYAAYLSYFGEIGSKAMFSYKDFELYEAIRHLSILKEQPHVPTQELAAAEEKLQQIQHNMGTPSEMALLSRLHWWTVEYGLIGTLENPKIYGAGLLSSIGESASCMQPDVPKLPYSLDAVNYAYDITQPQPQLFVTPTFEHLLHVLNDFADNMAFRKGGKESLDKAIECQNVCTAVYSSGLQVSGVFADSGDEGLVYLKTTGPTALAYKGTQLDGHERAYHQEGFGSPLGKLGLSTKPLEDFNDEELQAIRIVPGEVTSIIFESRIQVSGTVRQVLRKGSKVILISFIHCTVVHKDTGKIYFQPEWGVYDMAVGERIVSVFCGAADKAAYEQVPLISAEQTFRFQDDPEKKRLHDFYAQVRKIRETQQDADQLEEIWNGLRKAYPDDWLCALEILEIMRHHANYSSLANTIETFLKDKQQMTPDLGKLIGDGLNLIAHPEIEVLNK